MAEISKQALVVENNTSFPNNNNGAITPSTLRAFNNDMIDSTVNQIVFNNYSSSVTESLQALSRFTASVAGTNTFTASIAGTNAYTQSNDAKVNSLIAFTSSVLSISALDPLNNSSASLQTYTASMNSYTASNDAKVNSLIAFTSSVLSLSALVPLNNFTQSIQAEVDDIQAKTGSFATTGSNTFIGTETLIGSASISGAVVLNGDMALPEYYGSAVNAIRLFQGVTGTSASSKIQFWSGSYATQTGTYINLQTNPANGALAISAWPLNSHFVDFDGALTQSLFTAPIGGAAAAPIANTLVVRTNMTVSGSTSIALRVSSSAAGGGLSTLNPLGLSLVSGSTGQITANYGRNLLSLVDTTGAPTTIRYIAMAQNPSLLGLPTTTGYTAPSILAMNSGSQPEPVISFENRGNYTNGLITMVKPTRFLSGSITSGSALITGSLNVIGDTIITGSLTLSSSAAIELNVIGNSVLTGSVYGNVVPLTIASSTASMDCSLGNFFTLTLANSTTTHLAATNIRPGQTINILVTQGNPSGSISYNSTFDWPTGNSYTASAVNSAKDIVSFITFDSTTLYGTAVKNLV